ncbi:hypothetical protein IW140_005824 [Coemansia sp. RSA 1813]|nr:hypothetical protein IW140_005824 [Coemansia sp. RSA 1813]
MASMLLAASPSIALPTTEMSKRIVGGFLVASGFAPYAVFLQMANGGGSITVCGGSIISPEYVITAAHCVVADGKVRASSSITANYNNMDKAKQARVKALEVHVLSGYITKTGTDTTYDMAILKIPKLTFGQNTQRIPIYPGKIGANQDIMAIGWGGIESGGLSSQLRGVVLKTGDKKSCWGANSKVGDNNGAQVCALIKLTPNMSTCGGDSGSSVVIGNGNTPMLVGMVGKRVINGFQMSEDYAPYAVYIEMELDKNVYLVCGGSIISDKYIATAAHCVESGGKAGAIKNITIGYNSQDVESQIQTKPSRVVLHPSFVQKDGTTNLAYDLALLEIPTLKLNSTTQRIPLYTGSVAPGEYVMATGWGTTESGKLSENLRGVLQITGGLSECKTYGKEFVSHNGADICVLNRLTPGETISLGDSGAALVMPSDDNSGVQTLAGIASYMVSHISTNCGGTLTKASFFLRPFEYLDFITSTTGLTKAYLTDTGSATCSDSESDLVVVTKTVMITPTILPTY